MERFDRTCAKAKEEPLANLASRVAETLGAGLHLDFNSFMAACDADADKHGVKLTAKRQKLLQCDLCDTSEDGIGIEEGLQTRQGRAESAPTIGA